MKRSLVACCLLLMSIAASAQWQKVADNIFLPYNNGYKYGGQITYREGIVWGGFSSLFKSLDSGLTWQKVVEFDNSPNDFISSIDFFDAKHGLVTMFNSGAHVTSDGGKSWTFVRSSGDCLAGAFGQTKNDLIVVDRENWEGHILISHDFGKTWNRVAIEYGGGAYHLYKHPSGKIYVLARNVSPTRSSYIYVSTDNGEQWRKQGAKNIDLDCYSLVADPCDDNILYVINEDHNETDEGQSCVYRSIDGGNSFKEVLVKDAAALTGFCTVSPNALYVGANSGGGTFRSLDQGTSWEQIGGPENYHDTRMLCPIDDNIIIAADFDGNLWRTSNSGGDSVKSSPDHISVRLASPASVIDPVPGAEILVPISLKAVTDRAGFDAVVHYNSNSLEYRGTFAMNGDRIDLQDQSWPGRALIRFRSSDIRIGNTMIGYSLLKIKWYEPFCDIVRVDSAMGGGSSCSPAVEWTPTETIVGNFSGCLISDVTDQDVGSPISIRPNPTRGIVSLASDESVINISVIVLDALGRVIYEHIGSIQPEAPLIIDLSEEASGTYYLRLQQDKLVQTVPIVKLK